MTKSSSFRSFSIFAVSIAVLLHISILFFVDRYGGSLFVDPKVETSNDVVETRLVSPDEILQQMRKPKIVETEFSQDQVEESDGPVYAGEKRQRVKRQTVSSNEGSIKGGVKQLLKSDPLDIGKGASEKNLSKEKLPGSGILSRASEADEKNNNNPLNYGSLESNDVDAEFGPFTQLNTDEYRYASFFNRYRRSLYGIWHPLVWKYSDKEQLEENVVYLTKLSMRYTQQGALSKIIIETTSGSKAVDQAAVDSIKRMGFVHNIPSGLYNEDQLAVIPISFTFQLIPSPVQIKLGSGPRRSRIFR